jgi:hypothetical protein
MIYELKVYGLRHVNIWFSTRKHMVCESKTYGLEIVCSTDLP